MNDKTLGAYTRHESPDCADGGVAAALIEKEAEARATACTDKDAHWRLDEALETIERLTRERDEARGALRARLGVLAGSRPLTPDAITDAMVERAFNLAESIEAVVINKTIMRDALIAALTEPPARPAGAVTVAERLLPAAAALGIEMTAEQVNALADRLAAMRVRVVGGDGAA